MSYTQQLRVEIFCRISDRSVFEQLGFVLDPEFRAGDAIRMTSAGSRPLVATLMAFGEEGTVFFAFVTGASSHPPAALAADGTTMSFVRCDHETFDPIVPVTSDGTVVGLEDATAYWTIVAKVMRALGLEFTQDQQRERHA
jgi:hypothetical protein